MAPQNKQLWPNEDFPSFGDTFAQARSRLPGHDVIRDKYGMVEIQARICRYQRVASEPFVVGGWERALDRLRARDPREADRVEAEYAEMRRCSDVADGSVGGRWFQLPMLGEAVDGTARDE